MAVSEAIAGPRQKVSNRVAYYSSPSEKVKITVSRAYASGKSRDYCCFTRAGLEKFLVEQNAKLPAATSLLRQFLSTDVFPRLPVATAVAVLPAAESKSDNPTSAPSSGSSNISAQLSKVASSRAQIERARLDDGDVEMKDASSVWRGVEDQDDDLLAAVMQYEQTADNERGLQQILLSDVMRMAEFEEVVSDYESGSCCGATAQSCA